MQMRNRKSTPKKTWNFQTSPERILDDPPLLRSLISCSLIIPFDFSLNIAMVGSGATGDP